MIESASQQSNYHTTSDKYPPPSTNKSNLQRIDNIAPYPDASQAAQAGEFSMMWWKGGPVRCLSNLRNDESQVVEHLPNDKSF